MGIRAKAGRIGSFDIHQRRLKTYLYPMNEPRLPALGLDVGARRIGLAISDPGKTIASPAGTIETSCIPSCLEHWVDQGLECIVLGEPLQMDGSPSESAPVVQSVRDKIRARWPELRIYVQDERFTSKIAGRTLLNMGVPRGKRREKGRLDEMSAALILQDFLDREGWKKS